MLRNLGDQARQIIIGLEMVTAARTSASGGAPKISFDIDETKTRLLGLNLTDIARYLEAGLEGVTGGSLLEGNERLPGRVRVGTATRGDLAAISNFPILPPTAPDIAEKVLGCVEAVHARIAAISGLIRMMFMTRVRL